MSLVQVEAFVTLGKAKLNFEVLEVSPIATSLRHLSKQNHTRQFGSYLS